MPEYTLKRINASWMDLKGEQVEPFRAIRDYALAMGKSRLITEAVIVNLIQEFGCEKADDLVKRFIGRGFFSLDRLQGLIDGSDTRTFQKPYVNETPGKDRVGGSEPKTLAAMIPKTPEEFLNGVPVAIPKPKAFRLKVGHYTKESALEWMKQYHPADIELWEEEYFVFLGVSPGIGNIYQLRQQR